MYLSELISAWNSDYAVCTAPGTFSLDEKAGHMLHYWPLWEERLFLVVDWFGYRFFFWFGLRRNDLPDAYSLVSDYWIITAYVVLYLVYSAILAHWFRNSTCSVALPFPTAFPKSPSARSLCIYPVWSISGFWTAVLGMKVRVLFTLRSRAKSPSAKQMTSGH